MDFILGLSRVKNRKLCYLGHYELTKFEHFFMMNLVDKLAKTCMNKVVSLHGVPVSIVLSRDSKFTSHLWSNIQRALETGLNLSMTFHP